MGCDDRMLPNYLTRVHALLTEFPQADIVQAGVRVIDEHGETVSPWSDRVKKFLRPRGSGARVLQGEDVVRTLLHGNWTYFPSLVWRRSRILNGFRTDLNVVQDLAKILEILYDGGTLVVDEELAFEYRRHSSSVSARTAVDGSKYAQERVLFAEAASTASQRGWAKASRAASLHWSSRMSAVVVLPAAIARGQWAGAKSLLRHIFGPSRSRASAG
jgi:hypothetical protein